MGSHCCRSDVGAVAASCVGLLRCGAEDLLMYIELHPFGTQNYFPEYKATVQKLAQEVDVAAEPAPVN